MRLAYLLSLGGVIGAAPYCDAPKDEAVVVYLEGVAGCWKADWRS